ncbi:MAG: hypothetical protein IKY39_05370 [Clostridia bacterium]|nr:hypothetical protein [Clostridia bacterium]
MPTDTAEVETYFVGKKARIVYNNKKAGERKYFVNGVEKETYVDEISGYKTLFISNEEITEDMVIEVID